jgi:hypothetical protein
VITKRRLGDVHIGYERDIFDSFCGNTVALTKKRGRDENNAMFSRFTPVDSQLNVHNRPEQGGILAKRCDPAILHNTLLTPEVIITGTSTSSNNLQKKPLPFNPTSWQHDLLDLRKALSTARAPREIQCASI